MHSWWISHFGLWPASLTFKPAAACKTMCISWRVPHPLQGPHALTTTLINQMLVKKRATLSSYHNPSLTPLEPPKLWTTPRANCSSHSKHAVRGNWFHTCLCLSSEPSKQKGVCQNGWCSTQDDAERFISCVFSCDRLCFRMFQIYLWGKLGKGSGKVFQLLFDESLFLKIVLHYSVMAVSWNTSGKYMHVS